VIAVLDYGIGNLRSAEKALQHVGGDARLVADPDEAVAADGMVLPGVGAFGPCARALRASGLGAVATAAVDAGTPFLGICVGFQLLYEGSEEDPGEPGLGLLPGAVRRLPAGPKLPQMQWNRLEPVGPPTGILDALPADPWVYFVHSYAPEPTGDTTAVCHYGGPVVAAAARGPVVGVQFHPEKSGMVGLALLANFVRIVDERAAGAGGVAASGGRP
jgi:imidazole glycerol-phosphate synthase subunit HisH